MLGVYTGTAVDALTLITENDDGCDGQSSVTFEASSGSTYQIQVDRRGSSLGSVDVSWSSVERPPSFITKWGIDPAANGQFNAPLGVAVDGDGNVFVVDSNNDRVQKFSSTGTYLTQWGTSGAGNGQFNYPTGVAVDSVGNVYVTDVANNRVQNSRRTAPI